MAEKKVTERLPRPTKDLILVEEIIRDEKTSGGLYRPVISDKFEHMAKGKVLATGEGFYLQNGDLIKSEAKVGDTVLYIKMQTNEYREEGTGRKFYFLPSANVLAIL